MQTQITKILTKAFSGYSANFTYATDIPIRDYPSSQTYGIEELIKICDYADHIFYLDGNTFHFIDLLTGSSSTNVTDFQILEDGLSSSSSDDIVSKISAEWNTEKYNSETYQLDPSQQREEVYTGLSTGTTREITPLNYINSEVYTVLNRKKTLYLKDSISIKLGTVQNVNIGQVVNLVSDYATGSFVVTEKTLTKQGDELLSGLGTITY